MRGEKKQKRAQETENIDEDGREDFSLSKTENMAFSFGLRYYGLQRKADTWKALFCFGGL